MKRVTFALKLLISENLAGDAQIFETKLIF